MNAEFTRLPCCLGTDIPKFVAFSFSSGYKSFSSTMENKPYPRFYGCDEDKLYDASLAHILELFRKAHPEIQLFELPVHSKRPNQRITDNLDFLLDYLQDRYSRLPAALSFTLYFCD